MGTVASGVLANENLIPLSGLSREGGAEYTASCLGVPASMVPPHLISFVYSLSQGNPLYIRESVQQLVDEGHVQVEVDANSEAVSVSCVTELDRINVAAWTHTAMIGETVSKLEACAPLAVAVLKTCSTLAGAFTLHDLTATICSRFHGFKLFDNMRVYRAILELVQQGFLQLLPESEQPSNCYDLLATNPVDPNRMMVFRPEWFILTDMLMKKVAVSHVPPPQQRQMRRQALISRMISAGVADVRKDAALQAEETHIPWYYEDIMSSSFEHRRSQKRKTPKILRD